jgi:hypothetical protein
LSFRATGQVLLVAGHRNAAGASDELEALSLGFDAFLDAVLEPDVQQILITDAPAVLGLARFTELDERYAFAAIVAALRAATAAGQLSVEDPETVARMLLGALVRGGMLIAGSAEPGQTRDAVARAIRALLAASRSLSPPIRGRPGWTSAAFRSRAPGPRRRGSSAGPPMGPAARWCGDRRMGR